MFFVQKKFLKEALRLNIRKITHFLVKYHFNTSFITYYYRQTTLQREGKHPLTDKCSTIKSPINKYLGNSSLSLLSTLPNFNCCVYAWCRDIWQTRMKIYKWNWNELINIPIEVTNWEWASIILMHRICSSDQILMVLSSLTDTRNFPAGWTRNPRIQLSCPTNVNKQAPLWTFQKRILLSREPDKRTANLFSEFSPFILTKRLKT